MKTFPATHLNKHAKEVFAAAREDGSVVIEHNGYFGGVFAIVWNPQRLIEEVQGLFIHDDDADISGGEHDATLDKIIDILNRIKQ